MASSIPKVSLPLDKISAVVAEQLPASEYLTDRHSIEKGADYSGLTIKAKWLPEYETISVEVVFNVTAEQADAMKDYIEDDGVRDDIDSAVGELFESTLQEQYPDHDWSYPIGEVKLRCKKSK